MKVNSKFFKLSFSLLVLFSLLTASINPGLAQQPGPGGNTSDQAPTGAPVQPARTSPWSQPGAPPPSLDLHPDKLYVAATWSDASVHFLNVSMANTGSFPIGDSDPNGVAADGIYIYTGHHGSQSVRIFDYFGNLLGSWTDGRLVGLQGLELVEGELAVHSSATDEIHFFTTSGTYIRSIPSQLSIEGLAYDDSLLWLLGDATIIAVDPATGTVIRDIPNPSSGCPYGGTGLTANAPGELIVACAEGSWYRLSTLDGAVLASGNNGLDMYGLSSSTTFQMNPVYMRSTVGPPWSVSTNEAIMNTVFGAGYWQDLRYETVDPAVLFSDDTNLIFMEGSDRNADELEAFLTANQAQLESWVEHGGCLLINAAPNEGDGMSYGFGGVTLTYPGFSSTAVAVDPGHPIFNGPFTPVGTSFSGSAFSHASVSGGGVTDVLLGTGSAVPLAELSWGLGHAAFGGMTTTNFHSPQPQATNLRANLIYYLTTYGCQVNFPPVAVDDGTLFYEDFEDGYDNWTMDGLWNPENQDDTCGSLVSPFPSPSNAAYFGEDVDCNYDVGNISGTLTLNTPVFLPLDSTPSLFVYSYEETECNGDCEYDDRLVQVSPDGGANWYYLAELYNEDTWYWSAYDLSAYAGQSVLVRFFFDTVDSEANNYFGWMVDNIAIGNQLWPYVTDSDSVLVPGVFYNDYDPDGDELIIESYDDSGLLGTLAYNGDGMFTYDPNGAFDDLTVGEWALESFTYVISDGMYTDTAVVNILVRGLNDPPVAVDDSYTTPEDNTLYVSAPGVLGNDDDPEADPLLAELVEAPALGILSFLQDGAFAYIPPLQYNGVVTFTYVATDSLLASNSVSYKVSFVEPEFPQDTPVDGHVVTSLFGEPIPPLSFGFEVGGSPSISATFTTFGPGWTAYNSPPFIEGPNNGTLYVDFGVGVDYASFGFAVACPSPVTDSLTVTAYAADMTPVGTYYADGVYTGFWYAENQVELSPGTDFRSLEIDFIDDCGAFVVDNLTYNAYLAPTEVTIEVTPVNDPPIVDAGEDVTADEGELISFSGSYTDPGLLGTQAAEIVWDFGDGNGTIGLLTPEHTYGDDDVYTVTLTITDELGGVGSDSLIATIANVAPDLDPIADQNVAVSEEFTVTAFLFDPGWLDTHTLYVDWGDGLTETLPLPFGVGGIDIGHAYDSDGTFTVNVTLDDDDGGTDMVTFSVIVYHPNFWTYLPMTAK